MSTLSGKNILLCITGSIAAYKSVALTRQLLAQGADVQVVMTFAAQRFVTPMTLTAISGQAVRDDLWDDTAELAMSHIELARWADIILVAPASADVLARLAQGRADDLTSTLCLATRARIVAAPAMNHVMWSHAATQANVKLLRDRGVEFIGPESGELAERETGAGRMSEPETICRLLSQPGASRLAGALAGKQVVITAGPTREAIDPVRYLTNHSSGRMGYALAQASMAAGARVTLVSGPTHLAVPAGVAYVPIDSAEQMYEAVMQHIPGADLFMGAAAVADYRPAESRSHKLKKQEGDNTLVLTRNRDIIAEVTQRYPALFVLGFAAETQDMAAEARAKRQRKGMDMIAGNVVGADKAFGRDDNELLVIWEQGEKQLARTSKTELAQELVLLIAKQLTEESQDKADKT